MSGAGIALSEFSMDSRVPPGLAHHIRGLAGLARAGSLTDAELLAAFAERGDGEAFAALVVRHGQAVWSACRQVLDTDADAEDAFQATFITLARKAAAIEREPLAGWLRKVAHEVALNAYKAARRRSNAHLRLCEQAMSRTPDPPPSEDVWAAVREELAGLPERLRVPLTLFYLDGRTQAEMAELIGIAERSVRERLMKGLAVLRERLSRRGMAVTTAALVAILGNVPTLSAMPVSLVTSTADSALAVARGEVIATPAAKLAEQVAGGLQGSPLKKFCALLALVFGVGIGAAGWQVLADAPDPPQAQVPPVHAPGLVTTTPLTTVAAPVPTGPVVVGEVKAAGKPVPNANVVLLTSGRSNVSNSLEPDRPVWEGQTDKNGQFRATLPVGVTRNKNRELPIRVLASSGKAFGTIDTTYKAGDPAIVVKLGDGQPLRGAVVGVGGKPLANAVFGVAGKPVVGAKVRVWRIGPVWVRPSADAEHDPVPVAKFWPKPVLTDAEGKFSFPELGGMSPVIVEVLAPGFAREDGSLSEKSVPIRAIPPKWVTGKITAAESGKPVAGAKIGYPARFSATDVPGQKPFIFYPVGRDGTFKIAVPSGDDVLLRAVPPAGVRLHESVQLVDLDGQQEAEAAFALLLAKR
jgi:RNA polymerase sigma factor (sigma-70 family)